MAYHKKKLLLIMARLLVVDKFLQHFTAMVRLTNFTHYNAIPARPECNYDDYNDDGQHHNNQ